MTVEDVQIILNVWKDRRQATHWKGCELVHAVCVVEKLGKCVLELIAERNALRSECEQLKKLNVWLLETTAKESTTKEGD